MNTCTRRNSRLTPTEQLIHNFVSCTNDVTLKEIRQEVLNVYNERSLSLVTVHNKLKKLKITRKRLSLIPTERNSENNLNKRSVYAAEIDQFYVNNLIFLDETGFSLRCRRTYGYSSQNTKAYAFVPANRGEMLVSCA